MNTSSETNTHFSNQEINSCVEHLQNLIRFDTTNPPGNEIIAARYLKDIFEQEGIPYTILESAPGRANIIARIKGDGSQKPLLLTSHLDVVPCEKDKWDVDPFSGEIKDGFLWGRGTVDMKQMTAMELGIFLKAHRDKDKTLKRDLIFAAVADEEAGCALGSKWLVENHPDLIQAEYALNEVGGFSLHVGKNIFYPIGVAHRGICWFEITAKGKPGHGSIPHGDQAIEHICLAAHKLADNQLPFRKTEIVNQFLDQLANKQSFPKNLILKSVKNKLISRFVTRNIFPDKNRGRDFENMFRNTATPTMMSAGYKDNVIPSEASISVDGRILPKSTVAEFLAEVQDLIGPGFEITVKQSEEPCETDYDNDFYKSLCRSLEKNDPGCIPTPFLIPGFTDAKHYNKIGIKTFGFAPTKLPKDVNFGELFHGHNERIPVDSIGFGLNSMWDVILENCY